MSMPSSLALAFASSERALSQPWSAAGALKAIFMSPVCAALSSVAFAVAVGAAVFVSELASPPQATTPRPIATPATITGASVLNFMLVLLLIGLLYVSSCGGAATLRLG